MKDHESIPCKDGSSVSKQQAKFKAEECADNLLAKIRQEMLESLDESYDRIWEEIPFPREEQRPKDEEDVYSILKIGVESAMLIGIAKGLQPKAAFLSKLMGL